MTGKVSRATWERAARTHNVSGLRRRVKFSEDSTYLIARDILLVVSV